MGDVGNNSLRVRPTVKTEITNSSSYIEALVDGVLHNKTYYYNVYAKMRKNNQDVIVQLFDAGYTDKYESKTYLFTTLSAGEVYSNIVSNFTPSATIYGDRYLNTKFNLLPYANEYPYNFDLIYALCDRNDSTCGIGANETNIFTGTILSDVVVPGIIDTQDISEYDLEYNKDYKILVYAKIDHYDGLELEKINIVLNEYSNILPLKALTEPSFVITKNALVYDDNGNTGYGLDFKVILSDPDRTLVGGKYKVRLTDSNGNIVGNMQLKDDNGNYYNVDNYQSYEFDATVTNKSVRFINLDSDTVYTFEVYSSAYLNNYSSAVETPEEEYERKHPLISETKTAYTVDSYGVAFGRDITYSATARSIVVTFLGGSNFDNVKKVRYTIGLWDNNDVSQTLTGVFDLEASNKKFEYYSSTDDWKFTIDPPDMRNVLGQTYIVNMSFEIKVDDTSIWLTSEDNANFIGKAQYVED